MLRPWKILLSSLTILLVAFLALWLWVLASSDPAHNLVARYFPWPIACSTKGCVTTLTWQDHLQARRAFATTTEAVPPISAEGLTTLIRQHLARNALVRSPITPADARRYREEILNVKNEAQLQQAINVTLAEYDESVVIPFLQQEALRQERKAESAEELYKQLAEERWIIVLPLGLGWDKTTATVTTNSLYISRRN